MKSPKPSEYSAIDVAFLRPQEHSVNTRAPHSELFTWLWFIHGLSWR